MLISKFNIKDIKEYEENTGNNIISFFNSDNFKLSNIADLIRISKKNCTEEESYEILEEYMNNGNTLKDIMEEAQMALFGVKNCNDTSEENEEDLIDIDKYNSLTDLYSEFGMQLFCLGVDLSYFWGMNTIEMYKIFNSIMIKLQNDMNKKSAESYEAAALTAAAVVGKLPKKPPHIDLVQKQEETKMDKFEIMAEKMKSFANRHNNELGIDM